MYQHLLEQKERQLSHHPLFREITSLNKLKLFMERHVFAVWDFMTLAKRLQQDLTGTRLPWLPPANSHAARLINEIVLGEESDAHPAVGHCSHFEWYLEAMAEVGADTLAITRFIALQREGVEASEALQRLDVPIGAARFVRHTLDIALNAPVHCVAAVFLHGRESVIPAMFEHLLQHNRVIQRQAPLLRRYLERHVELDTQNHVPAATRLLEHLVGADPVRAQQAHEAALGALNCRIALWDEVRDSLQRERP
ncbi:DUF3050 domain-containing protein [Pseudomonas sp. SDO524_S393]